MAIDKAAQSEIALLIAQLGSCQSDSDQVEAEVTRTPFRNFPLALMKRSVTEMSKLKVMIRLFNIKRDPLDLLDEFREAKGPYGILSPYFLQGLEGGLQVANQIERLSDALHDLHGYQPEDYFTERAYCLANRKSAAQRRDRSPETEADNIKAEARRIGYFELAPYSRERAKKLEEIIAKLGLYKGSETSKASQQRHLKRILET